MMALNRSVAATLGVLFLLALGSCGNDDSGDSASKAATTANGALSPQELLAKVQASTVSVVTQPPGVTLEPAKGGEHAHGSGVIYDAQKGLVLVSNHLVENAGSIDVVVGGATTVHARLVARAQCNDFAVVSLRPKPLGMTAMKIASSKDVQPGDEVTAVGYLKSATAKKATVIRTNGEVSSVNISAQVTPDLPNFPSVILHQAPLQLQMSGGPLVNDRGELVGLATFVPDEKATGTWAAVSSDYLKLRLGELEGSEGKLFVGWKDQHACHGRMLKIADKVLVRHGDSGGHGGGH